MGMSLEIVEELIARQPPEAQAIIRLLLARIAELEARLNKSPQNSSLPPSSQHAHAKPAPKKRKSKRKRGGQPGHPQARTAAAAHSAVRRRSPAQTERVPPLRNEALRHGRSCVVLIDSVGSSSNQHLGDDPTDGGCGRSGIAISARLQGRQPSLAHHVSGPRADRKRR